MQHSKHTEAKNNQPISISSMMRSSSYRASQIARCQKTGQSVVIKKINSKISDKDIELYSKIRHPNIIRIIDFVWDGAFFVLEYVQGRTLAQLMKNGNSLHKDEIHNIFNQLCSAVHYLHSLNLYQFNIKPQNILIQNQNVVKICYFDLQGVRNCQMQATKSLEYVAPQILLKLPCCNKVDNWALGILLYFMIQGKTPFQGQIIQQMLNSIKAMSSFSKKFTPQQSKLITSLLKMKPKQRLDLSQILKPTPVSVTVSQIHKPHHQMSVTSTTIDEQPTISKEGESKIKLMEVKSIQNSSTEKKVHAIHITSIRKLADEDSQSISPSMKNQAAYRGQKCSFSLHNKQKISLRRFARKISKIAIQPPQRVSMQ